MLFYFIYLTLGTRGKCQEKASQFSRNTGSEEIDIQPINNDEDEGPDDSHTYTTKNFYNNDETEHLPPTTGRQQIPAIDNAYVFFFQILILTTVSMNLL